MSTPPPVADEPITLLETNLRDEVRLRRSLLEAEASFTDSVRSKSAPDVLEARVEALRLLTERARALAEQRAPLVTEVARGVGLLPDASLREICSRLDPEHAEILRAVRADLGSVLIETQLRVRADAVLLRQALDVISTLVNAIVGSASGRGDASRGYESAGRPATSKSDPLLFDADL